MNTPPPPLNQCRCRLPTRQLIPDRLDLLLTALKVLVSELILLLRLFLRVRRVVDFVVVIKLLVAGDEVSRVGRDPAVERTIVDRHFRALFLLEG